MSLYGSIARMNGDIADWMLNPGTARWHMC
jgi:hypothetical protein